MQWASAAATRRPGSQDVKLPRKARAGKTRLRWRTVGPFFAQKLPPFPLGQQQGGGGSCLAGRWAVATGPKRAAMPHKSWDDRLPRGCAQVVVED